MDSMWAFAFAVLFTFTFCQVKSENCSEVRCKLLPVEKGFASEFRLKASEKGVRLVYLNLKIGNESYDPLDVPDKFLSNNWVWANTIREPMLALPYDYDILSLGLLTYQVRTMDVKLTDQPTGCLANLSSSCQDKMVGKALLNLSEHDSGELLHEKNVVCSAVIAERSIFSYWKVFDGNVIYHCCRKSEQVSAQKSSVECELIVKTSGWFEGFTGILNILTMVMMWYCPVFLLAIPDFIFNLRQDCEEEKEREQNQGQDNISDRGADNQGTSNVVREPEDFCESESESTESSTGSFDDNQPTVQQIVESVFHKVIFGESGSESIESSTGSFDDNQQTDQQIESVDHNLVYLDDASPIFCSTFFSGYFKDFTDLIPFNVKLAFLCYCLIPIFVYIKLGINYTLKRDFFEEAFRKEKASLVGPLFSLLYQSKFLFITCAVSPLIMILFSSPKDFLLIGWCFLCRKKVSSAGDDMLIHIKKMQQSTHSFASWLIEIHKAGITTIYYTHLCLESTRPPYKRLKRALIVSLVLLCNAVLVTFFGVILGVVYFCIFLVGLGLLSGVYSPLMTIFLAVIRVGIQLTIISRVWLLKKQKHYLLLEKRVVYKSLSIVLRIGTILFCTSTSFSSTVACYTGAFSSRFIARMFGYVIMGLVLNADIASPFVTFFVVALTNLYLCYYNLQKRYQEVKEMISQQWQKHEKFLHHNNLSNSEEGTIPEDLFWHICGEKSISKHKVLRIRTEVFRMLFNMALILTFLSLALCSIIFLERTYSISTVVSTTAVFVSGVVPGLFFKGLTKENRFSGAIKSEMIKRIEKAVKEYIEIANILEPSHPQEVTRSCWI